jgi:hypothetical protein
MLFCRQGRRRKRKWENEVTGPQGERKKRREKMKRKEEREIFDF